MLASKVSNLKPLLESSGGLHVTAYFENRGDVKDFKEQIRDSIHRAHEHIAVVMNTEDQLAFLEPLEELYRNTNDLTKMEGSLGVFLKKEFFCSLNVPLRVNHTCQVATSFHIKPLLQWLQADEEFLLIGIDQDTVYLAKGTQFSFTIADSVSLQKSNSKSSLGSINTQSERNFAKVCELATIHWLRNCLFEMATESKPKLYLAGNQPILEHLKGSHFYDRVVKKPISASFSIGEMDSICANIRKIQRAETYDFLERSLGEFRAAEDRYRTRTNIFQIAKAVAQGRVRKLAISEEVSVFGKMDRKTGALAIHPFDLDHEDDDILDDLAQMVLLQGGDVIVVPQIDIPNRRPILAIVDYAGHNHDAAIEKYEPYNLRGKRA